MSNLDLSRDDFIKLHGFDPEEGLAPLPKPAALPTPSGIQKPGVGGFLRDVAVGAATAIPDIVGLPQTIGAGAKALYDTVGTDRKFLDSFAQNIRVEGADQRIQKHLGDVVAELRRQAPDIDDANMLELVQEYAKGKEFEDFSNTLLTTGPRIAAQAKDYVRGALGDHRTDAQRSWVDSAGEIIGGSLVPGPAGWAAKVGSAASRNAITNALVNNTVSRGALKTAEVLTPLTMPFSAGNVALNSAAGVVLDQGIRHATGRSTLWSDDDDMAIGGLAGVSAGVGAAAAFVGALKARGVRHLQQSQVSQAIQNNPALASRMSPDASGGQATIIAGKELDEWGNSPPTPYLDELRPDQAARWRAGNQAIDQGYVGRSMVEHAHDKDVAARVEATFANNTGAALNDQARALTHETMRPLDDLVGGIVRGLSPEEWQRINAGWQASNMLANVKKIEDSVVQEIATLQATAAAGGLRGTAVTKLQELQADLARLRADDPTARPYLPELTRAELKQMADAFENDPSPHMVKLRKAIEDIGDYAANTMHADGRISSREKQQLRGTNKYYAPVKQDPLEGMTGIKRAVTSFLNTIKQSELWDGYKSVNKSPLRSLELSIPKADEARVTRPLDNMVTLRNYVHQLHIDSAHIRMRNETINKLAYDAQGQPTQFMRNKNIERFADRNGRVAFSNAEIRNPMTSAHALANDADWIPTWNGGYATFYRFGDSEVTAMLRQDPVLMNGMMRFLQVSSQIFKANTTGILAPAFAAVNMYYDTAMGIATREASRAFGPMSYMTRKFLPQWMAKEIEGRVPDPTALLVVPWHAIEGTWDTMRYHMAQSLARDLAQLGPFQALAQRVGWQNYQQMVDRSLRAAQKTMTMQLVQKGVAYNSALDQLTQLRGAWQAAADTVPHGVKSAFNFYADVISALHLAPKRMFYSENFALLEKQYGRGNVPQAEVDKLVAETRALAGDMTRRPANITQKHLDAALPYWSPIRNGTYHLVRNMSEPGKAQYVLPRMGLMMLAVGQTFYMMQNWDDQARKDFWSMPDWERWRSIIVPTVETMASWFRGEDVPYSRDKVYHVRVAPDLAPIIAGTAAFMQQIGVLPANATPHPIYKDMLKLTLDSLTPAMPPALQALLGASGMKLDPQGADTRGGALIRQFMQYQQGPQSEGATNMGQVSNATALMMNGLFGANGAYVAKGADAFLHASKYYPRTNEKNMPAQRESPQYMEGLKAATTVMTRDAVQRIPDVPLVWQGNERKYVGTPAWEEATKAKRHISSINGMRDYAVGKSGAAERAAVAKAGGIPRDAIVDQALIAIGNDIRSWDRGGELGKLKQAYGDMAKVRRGIEAQYNMPTQERAKKISTLVGEMQDNLEQQRLAIIYKEQQIAEKYGPALLPRLRGRDVSMQTLDAMMRESIGGASPDATSADTQPTSE